MRKLAFLFSLTWCFGTTFVCATDDYSIAEMRAQLLTEIHDTTRARLLLTMANEIYSTSEAEAEKYCFDALQITYLNTKKIDHEDVLFITFSKLKSDAFNNLGYLAQSKGNFSEGIEFLEKAAKLNLELDNLEGVAMNYNNIHLAYFNQGVYDKAAKALLKAIRITEDLDNPQDLALYYANLVLIYKESEHYNRALAIVDSAIMLAKAVHDPHLIGFALEMKGVIYGKITPPQYEDQLSTYLRSLDYYLSANNKHKIAGIYTTIGACQIELGRFALAREYIQLAMLLCREHDFKKYLCVSHTEMSKIYAHYGNFDEAVKELKSALAIAKSIEMAGQKTNIYQGFYELYEAQKEYKQAFIYQSLYMHLMDSLHSDKTRAALAEMEIKYEMVHKEKEIKLLSNKKKIQEIELRLKEEQVASQSKQIAFFAIGFLLVVALVIFVIRNYRKAKQANVELGEQKEIIQIQKDIVERKNREVIDSINYAKRIQQAILTSPEYWEKMLSDYYVFFKPKDIVSGDFHWAYIIDEETIIWVVADCTGHGVPGAFMSMIGNSLLNEIIIENGCRDAGEILNLLRKGVINSLGQTGAIGEQKDGMDMALCMLNRKTNSLRFSGANNPLILVREGQADENLIANKNVRLNEYQQVTVYNFRGDKRPIGYYKGGMEPFTTLSVQLQKGDCIYIFSDGFQDQFGGPKGKKFKWEKMSALLAEGHARPMKENYKIMQLTLDEWRGALEQLDDVCVVGVRV